MDHPLLAPDLFDILVVRELRKAGFDVARSRPVRERRVSDDGDDYDLDLLVRLRLTDAERVALIGCRQRSAAVGEDVLRDLVERLPDHEADAALVFATADFTAGAIAYARDEGVALLRVVDGKRYHDTGGWGVKGHYPAWLPEHVALLVSADRAGFVTTRPLAAGQWRTILDHLATPHETHPTPPPDCAITNPPPPSP